MGVKSKNCTQHKADTVFYAAFSGVIPRQDETIEKKQGYHREEDQLGIPPGFLRLPEMIRGDSQQNSGHESHGLAVKEPAQSVNHSNA